MSKAYEYHRAKVDEQIALHQDRILWLSETSPCWADGEPVSPTDILRMTTASKEALSLLSQGLTP